MVYSSVETGMYLLTRGGRAPLLRARRGNIFSRITYESQETCHSKIPVPLDVRAPELVRSKDTHVTTGFIFSFYFSHAVPLREKTRPILPICAWILSRKKKWIHKSTFFTNSSISEILFLFVQKFKTSTHTVTFSYAHTSFPDACTKLTTSTNTMTYHYFYASFHDACTKLNTGTNTMTYRDFYLSFLTA